MHITTIVKALAAAACFGTFLASASAVAQQKIEVTNVWARATAPGQKVGGVYMDLRSAAPARLVAVSSSAAATVEIHNMTMKNGIMRMFAVDGIDLPSGQTVKLAPGGYHVMLIDLKRPLAKGESVPVTLTIEGERKIRQIIEIKAEVRDMITGHKAH